MALVECVPNISEGRRTEVVDALVQAVRRLRDNISIALFNGSVAAQVKPEEIQCIGDNTEFHVGIEDFGHQSCAAPVDSC